MLELDYRPGARGTPAFLPDAELVRRGEELCVRRRRGSAVTGVLRDGVDGETRLALTTEGEEIRVVVPWTMRAKGDEPVSDPLPIFTYGTLMRGGPLHGAIAKHAPRITPGHTLGRLFHLGGYPGLLPGRDPVHGELVTLGDPGDVLVELDELEEFCGYGAPGSLYRRVVLPVWSEGRVAIAWGYRYLGPLEGAPLIASGDWRRCYGASSALEGGA